MEQLRDPLFLSCLTIYGRNLFLCRPFSMTIGARA